MHERILMPLDGSKMGEAALPYIEKLISKLSPEIKAEVTLLQVVSLLTHYIIAGEASAPLPYTDRELKLIKTKAMDYLNKAKGTIRNKGIKVKIKVGTGKASDEIIKIANEIKADLIAMSTHGRSGFSRWAFGSVTDRVLQGADVPVLIVRVREGTKK
ncbi:universal stress protein [Chloroflexota bacterium]